jgi:hypothetical protein
VSRLSQDNITKDTNPAIDNNEEEEVDGEASYSSCYQGRLHNDNKLTSMAETSKTSQSSSRARTATGMNRKIPKDNNNNDDKKPAAKSRSENKNKKR